MAIDVDTGILRASAQKIEGINVKLRDKLNQSKQEVERLKEYYQGEAADETYANYESFASKYFQRYEDAIKKYVDFLRETADKYDGREGEVKALAGKLK